jgi:hypothetical protein
VALSPNLAEQGFTDVAARTRPGRDREEPTADVLEVLVQGIARRQPGLDRYEASPRIVLEADEEETAGLIPALGSEAVMTQAGRSPGRRSSGSRGRPTRR